MNPVKVGVQLKAVLEKWESSLDNYSDSDLLKKPAADSWSIGQLYSHLVYGTIRYHLKQIELCLSKDDNRDQKKTGAGAFCFLINGFPPVKIKVPPSKEYTPAQPENKQEIKNGFVKLKQILENYSPGIGKKESGKVKHPALGFLSAAEWYQLIEMHFRHHLRQKKKLDQIIKR
ncbi:MAG: hypothetical protein CVV24_02900 [Ignavibacteriae bacterium HGW-Ignavibacteriae-3]|nr:MAG: hypothetical protein CVV24_02900 [Ignavibacteriae bacterium HGW-Ignavibacteriae-3]